jgi:hypothetical protein
MKTYRIYYLREEEFYIDLQANTIEEAKEKWEESDLQEEHETGIYDISITDAEELKEKRYEVIDLQGVDFMAYTHDDPLILQELRERFWQFYQDDELGEDFPDITQEKMTIGFIEELWEVKIKEVK